MSQRFDLLIFDWDGTLHNSIAQIVDSLLFAAAAHQQRLSAEAARHCIGLGLDEVMQQLFPQRADLHAAIRQSYVAHHVAHAGQDQWFSGVAQMLTALRQQQKILAVATGKSRQALNRVLAQTHSQHLFALTRAASETRSKPDPLMLLQILQQTGVDVERAVMIGDSCYDLQMAEKIGMPSIAVTYGVHDRALLAKHHPLYIADQVADLSAYLLAH